MKRLLMILLIAILGNALFAVHGIAQDSTRTAKQPKHPMRFIDKNGDGYNDLLPDHDGDGIPDALDPDWQKQQAKGKKHQRFIDLDGDGINDLLFDTGRPQKMKDELSRQRGHSGPIGEGKGNRSPGRHGKQKGKK